MGDGNFDLPPGFQFRPTEEDLVLHFLNHKGLDSPSFPSIIPDLDCHLHNPWELNGKAMSDGDQWYFFSRVKENGETRDGFWKQLDIEEPVFTGDGKEVGIKKCFVFCMGEEEAMEATETNWVMIEYSTLLCNCGMMNNNSWHNRTRNRKLDYGKWALCRVFEKKGDFDHIFCNEDEDDNGSELSFLDEMFLSLEDDLDEVCSN